jgi:hypothetical protein
MTEEQRELLLKALQSVEAAEQIERAEEFLSIAIQAIGAI